jgi:maleylacetoacetate isomerase
MKLYSYWRSSASYRVRIALALKGLKADIIPVNLLKGEQKSAAYGAVNPHMRVPSLVDGNSIFTQSLAIIEYLEERYPSTALLPQVPEERAYVREIAMMVATDISPLNNSGTLALLGGTYGLDDAQKLAWQHYWMNGGFAAIEAMLERSPYSGQCCFGASPTMADCALIPQVYNARRFGCDMTAYPRITAIDAYCNSLPAFKTAHPDQQVDAA